MNQKELKELFEFLEKHDIAEFEMERGDVKVRIRRNVPLAPHQEERYFAAPSTPPPASAREAPSADSGVPPARTSTAQPQAPEEKLHHVRSPIVGTFYESPSPGSPPFVKPGDMVEVGQLLCIVEAMKLMNEIESDVAGEVVRILATNGQPIEYGQELFAIRPKQ
jgi:acetyl-CoA carboxylase biotin carboxyl carrier protein